MRVAVRIIAILIIPTLFGCELARVFRGNTRKKFGDYDIIDRQQYRHYLDNKVKQRQDCDREIYTRLVTEPPSRNDSKNTSVAGRQKTVPSLRICDREPASVPIVLPSLSPDPKKEYNWFSRLLRRLFRLSE